MSENDKKTIERLNQQMIERLNYQKHVLEVRIDRLKRMVEAGKYGGEDNREWLDQFAVGEGLDICCGDFPIRGADGVDGDENKIGAAFFGQGDELVWIDSESQDFIVTNYFDAMPSVLKALNEWWRVLKRDGTLAFICCNCDMYQDLEGPLRNHGRLNAFTSTTIRAYLERSQFRKIRIEPYNKMLRVKCLK